MKEFLRYLRRLLQPAYAALVAVVVGVVAIAGRVYEQVQNDKNSQSLHEGITISHTQRKPVHRHQVNRKRNPHECERAAVFSGNRYSDGFQGLSCWLLIVNCCIRLN